MYQRILHDPLRFPDEMPALARHIMQGLLQRDPTKRLGVHGAQEIKTHKFFAPIDWDQLIRKKITPPFKPSVVSNDVVPVGFLLSLRRYTPIDRSDRR